MAKFHNFKETVVIKDKVVSINPSRTTHKTFIEFDASDDTRRINIHGQEGDTGIWSLVHTSEKNLEFQYYENESAIGATPTQILTMKKETKSKAFSYVNRNLCFYKEDLTNDSIFRKPLQSNSIFVHFSNNSVNLSNSSLSFEYGTYEFTNRHLFFVDVSNSLTFQVNQESDFQSVIGLEFDSNNTTYKSTQEDFSFVMNVNFLDVNSQKNLIYQTSTNAYTSYANGFSGFLAVATGEFRNQANENNINLVNIDESLPVVTKCTTNSDPSVIGVIGRVEKNENFVERPFFWGAFGTTLLDRDYPRMIIASSGFVGIWVVVQNDEEKIEYAVGDLLTSHSSGAAIKQNDTIVHSYTIGKLVVNSSVSDSINETENTSQYDLGDAVLELKGVSLLL